MYRHTPLYSFIYIYRLYTLQFKVLGYLFDWSVCVCSNANPLHYCVLRVPHKADRWRWMWSIFNSRTAWADHITCGTSRCIEYWRKLRLGWLYVKLFVWCNCVVWDDDDMKGEDETRCRLIACSSRKVPRGPPGLMSPSDGRIAINSTICLLNIRTTKGLEFNPGLWCTI